MSASTVLAPGGQENCGWRNRRGERREPLQNRTKDIDHLLADPELTEASKEHRRAFDQADRRAMGADDLKRDCQEFCVSGVI